MNEKMEQIEKLLRDIRMDYTPSEQELVNFEYAYRLLIALASVLSIVDNRPLHTLGGSSQSTYLRAARELAGIADHDQFLMHLRDGAYGEMPADVHEELETKLFRNRLSEDTTAGYLWNRLLQICLDEEL